MCTFMCQEFAQASALAAMIMILYTCVALGYGASLWSLPNVFVMTYLK